MSDIFRPGCLGDGINRILAFAARITVGFSPERSIGGFAVQ
jgi:hypothetical protein